MRSCSYSPFPSGAPVYLHLSHIPVHHSLLEDQHANGGVLRYQCQSKEREVYHLLAWENCNGSSDAIYSDFQPIHDFVNALDFLRTRFYTENSENFPYGLELFEIKGSCSLSAPVK